jgi:DNA mismatch repair protein MutS
MREQFDTFKRETSGAVLLFRMGDFYEALYDDAKPVGQLLGLTITSRKDAPMVGFPYHQLDAYTSKLVASGKRVAVIEREWKGDDGKVERVVGPDSLIEA